MPANDAGDPWKRNPHRPRLRSPAGGAPQRVWPQGARPDFLVRLSRAGLWAKEVPLDVGASSTRLLCVTAVGGGGSVEGREVANDVPQYGLPDGCNCADNGWITYTPPSKMTDQGGQLLGTHVAGRGVVRYSGSG